MLRVKPLFARASSLELLQHSTLRHEAQKGGPVDSAVDAACALSLSYTVPFPASLILDRSIVVGVGQLIQISFLPEFKGDAVRFEDFFCRLVAEVSSPFICCSRMPEQSAMLHPINPRNDAGKIAEAHF